MTRCVIINAARECRLGHGNWDESQCRFQLTTLSANAGELGNVNCQLFKWRATLPGDPSVAFFEIERTTPSQMVASQLIRVPLLSHLLLCPPLVILSSTSPVFGDLSVQQLQHNWAAWLKQSSESHRVKSMALLRSTPSTSRLKWGITVNNHLTVAVSQKPKTVRIKRPILYNHYTIEVDDEEPIEKDIDCEDGEDALDDEKLANDDSECCNEEEEEEEEDGDEEENDEEENDEEPEDEEPEEEDEVEDDVEDEMGDDVEDDVEDDEDDKKK